MNIYYVWMKNDALITIYANNTETYRSDDNREEYISFIYIDKWKSELYGHVCEEIIAMVKKKDIENLRFSRLRYSL